MKIIGAEVSQQASHQVGRDFQRRESLLAWVGVPPPEFAGNGGDPVTEGGRENGLPKLADMVSISARARQLYQGADEVGEREPIQEDPAVRKIRLVLEALTGRKVRVSSFHPASGGEQPAQPVAAGEDAQGPPLQGWGLAYDFYEREAEHEQLAYRAAGRVQTADGRTIDFSLELLLHRETVREQHISIRAGDARLIDPLVINLATNSANLDGVRFEFDLTLDGKPEELTFVGAGSGFLALDRNGDGIINDGSELFGPRTGNGFAELAALDADGNGWLDANDPLFHQLRIWMKDRHGNDYLYTLAEKGIGAILLDSTKTPFSLYDQTAAPQGQLRETSIYLSESGRAGTVQHLDYLV